MFFGSRADGYGRFRGSGLVCRVLAGMTAASVQGLVAVGERAGMRVRRVLSDPTEAIRTGDLCYASSGFSLHAATRIQAGDTDALERLCRYVARPPLAAGSLTRISEDLLSFKLKTPWSDGTTSILLSPLELIEKLAALVPPPRKNMVRYHGVLAPHAKHREKIVPAGQASNDDRAFGDEDAVPRKYRLSWAALLARVFHIDALQCSCGGKMRIVAAITDIDSARRYLKGVGLPVDIPVLAPARAPPQTEIDYDW